MAFLQAICLSLGHNVSHSQHWYPWMIKCHLSMMMGIHKMSIADVARATDVHRNTIGALYHETAKRVDLDSVEKLCRLFKCQVGELFEIRY